jgi:hypothetical protein
MALDDRPVEYILIMEFNLRGLVGLTRRANHEQCVYEYGNS